MLCPLDHLGIPGVFTVNLGAVEAAVLFVKSGFLCLSKEKNVLLVDMCNRVCYLGLKVVAWLAYFTDIIFQYFQGFF